MLRSKDYAGDAELTAALDAYLANDSANPNTSLVYLNRAKYDLDRKCEQEEFFLNVLHHQTTNGFQDTGKFAELPTYTISVDGDLTAGILETLNAVVAAAGDTITVSVVMMEAVVQTITMGLSCQLAFSTIQALRELHYFLLG